MPAQRTPVRPATPTPSAPGPENIPDTVLLAVVGMSPAVLTETIWAMAQEPQPVLPQRVIAVTTTEGRRRITEQLFSPSPRFDGRPPWDALRDTLAAAGHSMEGLLRFGTTADDLRVITATDPPPGDPAN